MANTHSLDLESSSSQYAYITDAAQAGLDITGDISMEAWVNLESLTNQVNVISKYNYGTNNRSYYLGIAADGKLIAGYSDDGTSSTHLTSFTSAAVHVSTGQWFHIAVTIDVSAKTAIFYVNGAAVTSNYISGNATSIFNGAADFSLGCQFGSGSTPVSFLDGKIDDVRVWNDIRTANEIEQNFHKELVGNEANLQGYWKLNNDYTDETSNGNNLTASGSPVFATDPAFTEVNTYSLDLEADNQQYAYITDANQTGLDITGDLTIEAWIKLETVGAFQEIVTKRTNQLNQRSYDFRIDTSNRLSFIASSNGANGNEAVSTTTLSVSTWYHVAVSYDASAGTCEFYINGSHDVQGTGLLTSIFDSNAPVRIGAVGGSSGTPAAFLDGKIDEVRVWNDIRTSTEISDNYNKILVGDEANLQGYWRFENNYADLTANNNYLTPVNSPVFSEDVPFVGGLFKGGLSLMGVGI